MGTKIKGSLRIFLILTLVLSSINLWRLRESKGVEVEVINVDDLQLEVVEDIDLELIKKDREINYNLNGEGLKSIIDSSLFTQRIKREALVEKISEEKEEFLTQKERMLEKISLLAISKQDSNSRAILRDGEDRTFILRVGQRLGDYIVEDTEEDKVILKLEGEEVILRF